MDKVLHDILNAGIALFRSGEDSVNNAVKEVKRTFDELKSKGAADNSEPAVKLRKALDDIVSQTNDLSGKAGAAYKDTQVKIADLYANAATQIEKLVPKDQIQAVKDKVDELAKVIKEKTGKAPSMPK